MGLSAMSMMLKIKEVALLAFLLSVYATLNARHSGGVNSGLRYFVFSFTVNSLDQGYRQLLIHGSRHELCDHVHGAASCRSVSIKGLALVY